MPVTGEAPMPNDQRLEATVHGFVQGVFFRHNTRVEATRLGLAGTVRNRPDGTVGVIAEGPRGRLDCLLSWLHRGPELAEVERVDVEWKDATGACSDFRIVR
jgi:acylphosphatase